MRRIRVWCGVVMVLMVGVGSEAAEPVVTVIEPSSVEAAAGAVLVRGVDLIQTSQLLPRRAEESDIRAQTTDVLDLLAEHLDAANGGLDRLVKLNVYVTDDERSEAVRAVLKGRLNAESLPAVSWVTTSLPDEAALVAMDAIGWRTTPSGEHAIEILEVDGQAVSILPAGTDVRAYVSGQAEKGDGSVVDATRQTMASLLKTLQFLQLAPHGVVQVKAFVTPISSHEEVRQTIADAFLPGRCPPISLVEWESTLPIEIELVAGDVEAAVEGRADVEFLTPPGMTTPTVYCRVARVQHEATIFVSGLYGSQSDPDSEAELRELFDTTRRLVEAGGSDLRHLVKATYYVSATGSNAQHNKLRPEYYDPQRPPAASKAQVRGVGRPGRTITWDMIAIPKP